MYVLHTYVHTYMRMYVCMYKYMHIVYTRRSIASKATSRILGTSSHNPLRRYGRKRIS
jgi:hypothetical protein